MKFINKSVTQSAARIGTISKLERFPDTELETPLLLLYTKRGSVPHLTKDVLDMLTAEQQLLTLSLPTTVTMAEAVKNYASIGDFVGLRDHPMFLTIQDPAEATNSGHVLKDAVAIWAKQGKQLVDPDQYMDIVETFKPDLYVALCDGDTNVNSSAKRIAKSIERSKRMLERCLARHNASETISRKVILGAIEGGYSKAARELSIKNMEGKPLAGFIIDGLHTNGPETENITSEQIDDIIKHTINLLPTDKLRVAMGSWNPATLIDLVDLGVDVFDSSYPYIITERSNALVFMCEHEHSSEEGSLHLLSMRETRYADDFSPICESCKCLTCQNHTRAYLHHLHHTRELLGLVLLMIHNSHHYIQFFKAIRNSLKSGTFPEFKAKIHSKFPTTS